ncbi:hypothetical protein BDV12DRAFT_165270 [Aspergillus spectabilis]
MSESGMTAEYAEQFLQREDEAQNQSAARQGVTDNCCKIRDVPLRYAYTWSANHGGGRTKSRSSVLAVSQHRAPRKKSLRGDIPISQRIYNINLQKPLPRTL